MKRQSRQPPAAAPNSPWMALGSLLILIHFFCIAIAFSGNVMRSELQDQLLRGLFRPYLQPLNFDPDATPYHLTRGTVDDVDHRWEVLPAGENADSRDSWIPIPAAQAGWSDSSQRWRRMAKVVAFQIAAENEEAAAELARGVAHYAYHRLKIRPQRLRCRRMNELQTWGDGELLPREIPYVVNVVIDDQGRVSVARISDRRETALPETETTPNATAP